MSIKKYKFLIMFIVLLTMGFSFNIVKAGEELSGKFVTSNKSVTWKKTTCGWFTVSITIDGKSINNQIAFCGNHDLAQPYDQINYKAKVYYPGDSGYDKRIASILYYGYGGPGAQFDNSNESLAAMDMALWKYYANGDPSDSFNSNPTYNALLAHAEAQDCPDGVAYILFTTTMRRKTDGKLYQPLFTCFGAEETTYKVRINKTFNAGNVHGDVNSDVSGCQFTIYSDSSCTQAVETLTISGSGSAESSDLDGEEYWIKETYAPDHMNLDGTIHHISKSEANDGLITVNAENGAKGVKLSVRKLDSETGTTAQGDATLRGAMYGLYSNSSCTDLICTATIGSDLSGEFGEEVAIGNTYYVKEISPSDGYLLDTNVYPIYAGSSGGQLTVTSREDVIRGDIKILKKGGATDYQSEVTLQGIEFKAYLTSDPSQEYYATTNEKGEAYFYDLPYGRYTVVETLGHVQYYPIDDFQVAITEDGHTYTYTKTDAPKRMHIKIKKVDIDRLDTDPPYYFQGDATLQGAKYGIYYDEECTQEVGVITVDKQDSDGYWYAESLDLLTDTYYVKELISHSDMINGKQVDYSYAEGYLVDPNVYKFEGNPETQTYDKDSSGRIQIHEQIRLLIDTSYERVVLGRVYVRKYNDEVDSSTESPASGAKLILTLRSRPEIQYVAYVQPDGTAEFKDPRMEKYSPYTIPYGIYDITEEASTDNKVYYFMNSEEVVIGEEEEVEVRTISDDKVQTYLKLVKKDKVSKLQVKVGGGVYKIWDCQEKAFIVQDEPFTGHDIDEFVLTEEGFLITPRTLLPGDYIIYEIEAPKGYYLDDEYRLPENPADYGKKGGAKVTIDKITDGLPEDAEPGDTPIYVAEISNTPLMGNLEIYKTGEQLTDYTIEWDEAYGDVYKPVYTTLGLKGVTYNVYAAEDIKSPDGTYTYTPANTLVDTITTDENGYATTKDLYLGKYRVEEVETPTGFIPEQEELEVTLTNEDQYVKVKTEKVTLNNVRRHFELNFYKTFENGEYIYSNEEDLQATFGLYTNEDIRNVNGDVVIPKDSLIDIIVAKEGEIAKSSVDMPAGRYYYLELDVSSPRFKMDTNKHQVEAKYDDTTNLTTTLVGENVNNEIVKSDLYLFKVSVSTFMKANNTGLRGTVLDMEHILEQIEELEKELADKEEAEAEGILTQKDLKLLSGAEYTVYVDEECTTPLKRKNGEEVKITTDLSGIDKIEDMEMGTYYIKETKVPSTEIDGEEIKYDLKEEPLKVELTLAMDGQSVYRALVDTITLGTFINKTDIFTGDLVPDCEFEIRDLDGNVVIHSITDEEGKAFIPLDLLEQGKEYIFQELNAPDVYKEDGKLYKLNTEEHHFTAEYEINEETNEVTFAEVQEVENYRPTIDKLIVRKVDSETGEPLEGCKFSIVLLDENGEPYVNEAGETVYLVKEGITGENGEYELENPVYGTYKFIEIEAPEGYELDDGMDGMVFTINDKTEDTLIFEVTNTGDIAVIALVCVAIVCVLGIVFVIVRNKKKSK